MAVRLANYPKSVPDPCHQDPPVRQEKTKVAVPGIGAPNLADQWPKPALESLSPHVQAKRHPAWAILRHRGGTRSPRNSPARAGPEGPSSPVRLLRVARNDSTRKPRFPGNEQFSASNATRPTLHRRSPPTPQPPTGFDGQMYARNSFSCRHCAASSANKRCSAAISPRGLRPRPSGTSAPRKPSRS